MRQPCKDTTLHRASEQGELTNLAQLTVSSSRLPHASLHEHGQLSNYSGRARTRQSQAPFKASTPGRTLPSRSSKLAPPPVLQWVTLSSVSYFLQAVAVSPPPITVTTPAAVASTTASMSFLVPTSNLDISKTPIGPFHRIVLDSLTAAAFISQDLGPQSRPMKPSGMPPSFVASLISPSSPNFEEMVKSTGKMISTPSFFAFSMISGTILAPSSS